MKGRHELNIHICYIEKARWPLKPLLYYLRN